MAIYKEDIVDIDLETGKIQRSFLTRTIGMADNQADRFGVRVFRNGSPVELSGVSVQGYFRNSHGENIAITSNNVVSGNVAEVVLPQACYNYDGQFCLAIKLVGGGVTGTMRIVDGVVDNTNTTSAVAPTNTVPTYQEVIAQYDAMVAATLAANQAIAPLYADLTFPVYKGDYCIYNGALKRAKQDIEEAETWTRGHWATCQIGPDLKAEVDARIAGDSELKSAFNHLAIGKNMIGTGPRVYYPIYVKKGDKLVWAYEDGSALPTENQDALFFYDKNKTQITYWKISGSSGATSRAITYNANTPAYYIKLNRAIPKRLQVEFGDTPTTFEPYYGDVGMVSGRVDELFDISTDVFKNELEMVGGYWAVTNGAETSSDYWIRSTKYIPENIMALYCRNDLLIYLQAWDKTTGNYVGTWINGEFSTTYVDYSGIKYYNLSDFRALYPNYKYTIVAEAMPQRAMTVADYSEIIATKNTGNEIKQETTLSYTPKDVYEYGTVSAQSNLYVRYPAGSPTNRARVKKEHLQKVPEGATTFSIAIQKGIFANGLYKVGWAFYTADYRQIYSSIGGWYQYTTIAGGNVSEGATYFMFLIASVNDNTVIDIDSLDLDSLHVHFDGSDEDVASWLLNPPLREIIKEMNVETEADNTGDYFIYSVNHRGYSVEAPENTIPAYILSKKKGFKYAECDVEFTSDNVAVLLHDSTINRTARNADGTELSSTVYIGDITLEQAEAYDFGIWMGPQWAGTKIPTFDAFILACKKLSLHPFIELKDAVNGTYWTDSRIKAIADSVNAVGMGANVSFISFAVSALQKISAYFPDARLGLGFEGSYTEENFAKYISNAQTLVDGKREVIATVNYSSMTSTLYSMLLTAGIKPLIWTVNRRDVILSMNETVVGVLSDIYNAGEIIVSDMYGSLP